MARPLRGGGGGRATKNKKKIAVERKKIIQKLDINSGPYSEPWFDFYVNVMLKIESEKAERNVSWKESWRRKVKVCKGREGKKLNKRE